MPRSTRRSSRPRWRRSRWRRAYALDDGEAVTAGRRFAAVLFDVQGTLTDFWSTLLDHGQDILGDRTEVVDWPSIVTEWRAVYRSELAALASTNSWRSVRSIYAAGLAEIIRRRGLREVVSGSEVLLLSDGWERLRPWPDSAEGLRRLRRSHPVAALSNADVASVIAVSRAAGLEWDAVFSAQMFQAFKPHSSAYLGAATLSGEDPDQILMVASHRYDLDAAAALGFGTAFVFRPFEYGPGGRPDVASDGDYDFTVESVGELADLLGS